ncbi:MAG: hypothetical protein UY12_C0040G0004 [Parcubacteria group bacterium GW2011_GWA2_47_8b]|nr:MAG: hypothetical protein UY12_C0040G0004 [Parcubacteria group bacterium GW2011_GWA2_47_8b]
MYDLVIIGGGPGGVAAGVYGQPRTIPKNKHVLC